MTDKKLERMNYFTGEALLTDDFVIEQNYFLTTTQDHNRYMHTWGIAYGLNIIWQAGQKTLTITEGMAVNGLGKEIILFENETLEVPSVAGQYYLTVACDEVLTDYTEETAVKGYKHIEVIPKFEFLATLNDPSTTILLAIITITENALISSLEYDDGLNQRYYCSIQVGAINFHRTDTSANLLPSPLVADPSISIKQTTTSENYTLYVNSAETEFTGDVKINGNSSTNSLAINTTPLSGAGTISSNDCTVTPDNGIVDPNLLVGDMLISIQTPGGPEQMRFITAIENNTITVNSAFNPALLNSAYQYAKNDVMQITNTENRNLLKITDDGVFQFGDPNLAELQEVNVSIVGNLNATKFSGDGSGLVNLSSVWTQNSDKTIYYNEGNVGIGTTQATALFQVQGTGVAGTGTISCNFPAEPYSGPYIKTYTVYGNSSNFTAELNVGSMVIVGNSEDIAEINSGLPIVLAVNEISSDGKSFTVNISNSSIPEALWPLQLVDSAYSIVPNAIGSFGTTSEPNILAISPNGSVDVNGVINIAGSYTSTELSSPPQDEGNLNCGTLNAGPYGNQNNVNPVARFYGDVYVYGNLYYVGLSDVFPETNVTVQLPKQQLAKQNDEVIEIWGNKNPASGVATINGMLLGSIVCDQENQQAFMQLSCSVKNNRNHTRTANCFAGMLAMNNNKPAFVNTSFSMPIYQGETWSVASEVSKGCNYKYCIYFIPFANAR